MFNNKKLSKEKIKTWFVTGASSGIGYEICKQLLEKGYNVIAVSRRVPNFTHQNALCLSVDVTKPESIKEAMQKGIEKFKSIEVLSNNAGISSYLPFEEETAENMRIVMETNFWGTYNTIREFVPYFRQTKKGTIINNSSECGIIPRAFGSAYCASKHAIEGLSSALWHEIKSFCRVITVELSFFKGTEISKNKTQKSSIKEYEKVPILPLKIKIKQDNDIQIAVKHIIEEAEKKKPQRRLMLGADIIKKIDFEIKYLKNDLKKSKKRALSCASKKENLKKEYNCSPENIALLNFHWENDNFGAVLTSCALNIFLNQKGYNAQNIDYIPTFPWIREEKDNKSFNEFREKYLPSTKKIYEYSQLPELNKYFSTFIVGSDQVFRYPFIKHDMEAFFLNFADSNKNIISAAASFGSENVKEESKNAENLYKLYLSNFNALSIREKSGVEYCEKLGIKATQTIDPVFYIEKNKWEEIANNANNKEKADFVFYTINSSIENDIKDFAEKNKEKLNITTIENITRNLSIESWLYKIQNCKFFMADSFHGICFAIIFNKPFVCVRKAASTRMKSILDSLGIKDRLYKSFEEVNLEKISEPIDYIKVNEKISELANFAINWLIDSIDNPNNNIDYKNKNKKEILKLQLKIAKKNYLKFIIKSKLYKLRAKLKKKNTQKYLGKADSSRYIYRNCKFIFKKAKKEFI